MRCNDGLFWAVSPLLVLLVSCGGGGVQTESIARIVPTTSPSPTPTNTPSESGIKFGAFVLPNPSASPGLSSVASLQTALGITLDYDLHYEGISFQFPGSALEFDAANGSVPIVSLGCNGYTNADIAAGLYDDQIDANASELKAYGGTVLVRYLWEMNAPIPTNFLNCAGPDDTGGYFNPVDFIAAWDRIRAHFIADGATNVKWFWCAGGEVGGQAPYFPGSDQVDYIGMDYYDHPTFSFAQFASGFAAAYTSIESISPGKPFYIGETGATAADQLTYFAALPALFATMPNLVGWDYFDAIGPKSDWRVLPGTAEFTALQNLIEAERSANARRRSSTRRNSGS